jgi:metacaspase-1
MPSAMSLHIGLNVVDPSRYSGWNGQLTACVYDAQDMYGYCASKGFASMILADDEAFSDNILARLRFAADELQSGDIFALTYSGHGGQVPDPREEDGQSETWVLYDRQLVDDEIYLALARFRPGVRIVVLSDSCHSGTVIRGFAPVARHRAMPPNVVYADGETRGGTYREIQKALPKNPQEDMEATALLISGCQDNQVSLDGQRNGAFTARVREVLAQSDAGQRMGYRGLRRRVLNLLPPTQSPNYFTAGPRNTRFENQQPFTV